MKTVYPQRCDILLWYYHTIIKINDILYQIREQFNEIECFEFLY